MAEFEETLRIIVKTQDETTAVVTKIDGEMAKLNRRQQQVVTESQKLTRSLGSVGDAFGMIIRRSPYVLAADFVARVAGFRNLMDLFNTSMNAAADATRDFGKQMLGIDVAGEKFEARIRSIREQYDLLTASINKREGKVTFGENVKLGPFAPQMIIPENVRGLEEAQQIVLELTAKLERLNQTTHEGRERYLEQNDAIQRAIDLMSALSAKTQAAADAAKALKVHTGGSTSKPGGWALETTKGVAEGLNEWVRMERGANEAMAEHVAYWQQLHRYITESSEAQYWEKYDAMERMAKQVKSSFGMYGSGEGQSDAVNAQNTAIKEQADLWRDVGRAIKESAGDAIGNLLTDIQNGNDALRNMARFLQGILNQAAGNYIEKALFQSAKGNVFSGGDVVPFARGGIVGGPTVFPMSGGRTGLMGEAGPEAVVPLRRGPNGSLGIESSGSRSTTVHLQVVSLDPKSAADVILDPKVFSKLADRIAAAINMGESRALRTSIAGVR